MYQWSKWERIDVLAQTPILGTWTKLVFVFLLIFKLSNQITDLHVLKMVYYMIKCLKEKVNTSLKIN